MPIEMIPAYGWPNCYRIFNSEVELIVTSDVGPRIMRYAFHGERNLFVEFPDQLGKSGEAVWVPRGGSRIWMAPEDRVRTYCADNFPVEVRIDGDELTAIQPVEPETGLEKQISIQLAPTGTHTIVTHRLKNMLSTSQQISAWALTMLTPGGMGITGLPPRGTHPEDLAPTNPLIMWAFTDLSDRRWRFTTRYIMLRQEPGNSNPQKLGHFNADTWGAYVLDGTMFLKRYQADATKPYPDFGCSFETFTNAAVLELETLGPLTNLAPGETVEHVEHWSLYRGISISDWTDSALDKIFAPIFNGKGVKSE